MTRTPTQPDLAITAAVRPSGTPTLQDALPKALAAGEAAEPGDDSAAVAALSDPLSSAGLLVSGEHLRK